MNNRLVPLSKRSTPTIQTVTLSCTCRPFYRVSYLFVFGFVCLFFSIIGGMLSLLASQTRRARALWQAAGHSPGGGTRQGVHCPQV